MNINVQNFKSILELLDYFRDDSTCKAYLAKQRWGDTPTCHHCGNVGAYVTNRGYRCSAKECGKKFTVTTGTVLENTKKPLRLWFAAIYFVTANKKGISSPQLARHLNITQPTAWFLLHRVRIMIQAGSQQLSGVVEVDETYIGGAHKNKHKKQREELNAKGTGAINKAPVLAMLERGGNVVVQVIDKTIGAIVRPLVLDGIAPGSCVVTDGHGAYAGLGRVYQHEVVNHEQDEWKRGDVHTNSVEGFFSHLKRMINGTYHQVSVEHLGAYCQELAYRFNTRHVSDCNRFVEALGLCDGKRLRYVDLVGRGKSRRQQKS